MAARGILEQERLNGEAPEKPKGSGWQALPQKLKNLIIAIILLVIVAVIFLIIVVVFAVRDKNKESKEICTTRQCIESAGAMQEYMDFSTDPCQDFAQFTCGGFYTKYKHPPKATYNPFSILGAQSLQPVKNILEDVEGGTDSSAVLKMKVAYQSCINDLSMDDEQTSTKKLIDALTSYLVEQWPPDLRGFDMNKGLGVLLALDIRSLFYLNLAINRLGKYYIFEVKPIVLYNMNNEDYLKSRQNYMEKMFKKFNFQNPKQTAENTINFEKEIAELSDDSEPGTEGEYDIEQMQNRFPNFNWATIVEVLYAITGQSLNPEELLIRFEVMDRNYMDNLNSLVASTPRTTIASYMIWKFFIYSESFLGPSYNVKGYIKRNEGLFLGNFKRKPIWQQCIGYVKPGFMKPLTFEYANVMFDKARLEDLTQQFDLIKEAFRKRIHLQDWLDEETKQDSEAKIKNFKVTMAYPPALLVRSQIDNVYADFTMDPNNFLANRLRINLLMTSQKLASLLSTTDMLDWQYDPTNINAFNKFSENYIVIPIGILYPPFYQLERPQYLNFASIGSTLAHEMGHGFDNHGIKYSVDGSDQFFSEEMTEVFSSRAQCVVDQYSKFVFNASGIVRQWDGAKSLSDDIADGIGLMYSYLAYLDWEAMHGEELGLPSLNYTNHQLFYILYAQQFCGTYTRQGAQFIANGDHSPERFRIVGSIQNSVHFGDVFNCPLGSPMNPDKKCNIWE